MTQEAIALVEANARLLMDQALQARLAASRLEAALSLVVGAVANDPDLQGSAIPQGIAGRLGLCVDALELAAQRIGRNIERASPAILRAAAGVLCEAQNAAEVWEEATESVAPH